MINKLKLASVISDEEVAAMIEWWEDGDFIPGKTLPPEDSIEDVHKWWKSRGLKSKVKIGYRGLRMKSGVIEELMNTGKIKLDKRKYDSWTPAAGIAFQYAMGFSSAHSNYPVGIVLSRDFDHNDIVDVNEVVSELGEGAFTHQIGGETFKNLGWTFQCEILARNSCTYCDLDDIECIVFTDENDLISLLSMYMNEDGTPTIEDHNYKIDWNYNMEVPPMKDFMFAVVDNQGWSFYGDWESAFDQFGRRSDFDCSFKG